MLVTLCSLTKHRKVISKQIPHHLKLMGSGISWPEDFGQVDLPLADQVIQTLLTFRRQVMVGPYLRPDFCLPSLESHGLETAGRSTRPR